MNNWMIIALLALGTFTIRIAGAIVGQRFPSHGGWARAINALPGTLIVSLVAVSVISGGMNEWIAGLMALVVAFATRSLPLTMAAGIFSIWLLRHYA